jgi:uncharacterized membrane protein HdeD (DUF308 family)
MTDRKKNPRSLIFAMDLLHLIIGAVIVILAVLAFLNPDAHMIFFPIIFLLAAALNLANGIDALRTAGRDKKRKYAGVWTLVFGVLLLVIGIISAVCIV